MKRYLSYANVMSTLAVFGVLAGGSAYAVNKIGSKDIKPRAVAAKHLKLGAVRGKHVRERTLDARRFSAIGGVQEPMCTPSGSSFIECAETKLALSRPGRAMVVVSGASFSSGSEPAKGNCRIEVDGAPGLNLVLGEQDAVNTSSTATDGFGQTLVTGRLTAGTHSFGLFCNEVSDGFVVDRPTIAAIALTHGRR